MFVFKNKKLISAMAIGSLMAIPAIADNSSTSATPSDSTGLSFDPRIDFEWPDFYTSAGKVEIQKQDLKLSGGQVTDAEGDGKTLSAKAKVNLHLWGSQSKTHVHGVLLDPGVSLRLDRMDGQDSSKKTDLEITGVAAYRAQGTALHATNKDKANLKELMRPVHVDALFLQAEFARKQIALEKTILAAEKALQTEYAKKELADQQAITALEAKRYGAATARQELLDGKVAAYTEMLQRHKKALEAIKKDQTIADVASYLVDLYDHESKTTDASKLDQFVERQGAPTESEAHATGDVVVAHGSYKRLINKRTGVEHHGGLITPVSLSGHAAFRINDFANIGFCGAVTPLEILAGKASGMSRLSTKFGGCADLTLGEFPTIRASADYTHHWDTTGRKMVDGESVDAGNNGAHIFSGRVSVSKKLGPVTPELGWTHEIEKVGDQAPVRTDMFTAGTAF